MTVATTLRLVSQVVLYVTVAVGGLISFVAGIEGHFGFLLFCQAVPPIVSSINATTSVSIAQISQQLLLRPIPQISCAVVSDLGSVVNKLLLRYKSWRFAKSSPKVISVS